MQDQFTLMANGYSLSILNISKKAIPKIDTPYFKLDPNKKKSTSH